MTPEERLAELGHELPAPNPAVANYVGAVTVGNIVFVSGHGPYRTASSSSRASSAARSTSRRARRRRQLTILNLLASLKAEIGELDRVKRVVKLLVLVNSDPEFGEQPTVANGASDLLVDGLRPGARPARPLGGRDGRAAVRDPGRDRGDLRDRVGRRRLPATEEVAGRPREAVGEVERRRRVARPEGVAARAVRRRGRVRTCAAACIANARARSSHARRPFAAAARGTRSRCRRCRGRGSRPFASGPARQVSSPPAR